MKSKLALGLFTTLFAAAVYAQCTSTTVVGPDGRIIMCQTCCYQGQCTTVCY